MSISQLYQSGNQLSNVHHFSAIAQIAAVDGEFNEKELRLLKKFAYKLNIDEVEYANILNNLKKFSIPSSSSKEERLEYMYELFCMIYADHDIDEHELKLIHKYAIGLGCTSEKAAEVIKKSIKIFSGEISFENYKYLLDHLE